MFEPQATESQNAMPVMGPENAASATELGESSFRGCPKGHHRKRNA